MSRRRKKKILLTLRSSDPDQVIRSWVHDIFRFPDQKRGRGNPRRKKEDRRTYKDVFSSFDIETTNYKPLKQSFLYLWSFTLDKYTIQGRTWEQARILFEELASLMDEKIYLIVWIHNDSYEFQFMKSVFDKEISDIFALDNRKVVKFSMMEHIEFRCSWILTNNSLATFTKNMNVSHKKKDGAKFDYMKVRTPGKDLKRYELIYSWHDTLGLVEALKVYFQTVGCNFYNIPLTNTGFVRNDLKLALRRERYSFMRWLQPDLELLHALHSAFRGGDTHANYMYSDRIIEPKKGYGYATDHDDRESSYPAEMFNKHFPMTKFVHVGPISLSETIIKIQRHHMAALLVVQMGNVKLRDKFNPDPYLSFDKCRKVEGALKDNGRIVMADYLETTITDVDLRIIKKEYSGKIKIIDSWFSTYKPLPESVKDVLRKYGQAKTALKGVPGQELNYQVAKGRFNSIYGCCVMYPIKPVLEFVYDEDLGKKVFKESKEKSEEELLQKYSQKGFLPYQWGVWVTAWARLELRKGMYIVGHNLIYTDTDSLVYIPDKDISFDEYNRKMIRLARKNKSVFIDKNGEEHYLGRFLPEEKHDRFVTLGAKKYASEDNGQIHLTVSGVSKKKGAGELKRMGGLEAFRIGTVFKDSAGTEAWYNDTTDEYIKINGERIHITSNLYLQESEYTLGVSNDYETILEMADRIWNGKLDRNSLLTR